jgi:hypothetical protein
MVQMEKKTQECRVFSPSVEDIVPLAVRDRGRGSRAVFKLLQNGALVHDASYYLPIQLEGPQASICDRFTYHLLDPLAIFRLSLHYSRISL